jgi:hypothetical protein
MLMATVAPEGVERQACRTPGLPCCQVALMTLDGAGQLGGNNEARGEALPARHRPRLSPPGCAMLALLLRFPQARARANPPRCTPPAHSQMPPTRTELTLLHVP